jgi:hypothetical protein
MGHVSATQAVGTAFTIHDIVYAIQVSRASWPTFFYDTLGNFYMRLLHFLYDHKGDELPRLSLNAGLIVKRMMG